MINTGAALFSHHFQSLSSCLPRKCLSASISRGSSSPCMKKELWMVGWPTKTFAINTIDLHPRDGGRMEWREAEKEKDKNIDTRGREARLVCRQLNMTVLSLRVGPLCFQWLEEKYRLKATSERKFLQYWMKLKS